MTSLSYVSSNLSEPSGSGLAGSTGSTVCAAGTGGFTPVDLSGLVAGIYAYYQCVYWLLRHVTYAEQLFAFEV